MFRYALLRILGAIPTLFLVIAIAFLMVHSAPGGPFDSERALSPEIERNIARAYHLDESLPQQFARYIRGVWRGDFGPSFSYRDTTVSELIRDAFPVSMRLGLAAMVLALCVGITSGLLAALRRDTFIDRMVSGISMIGISVPVFVVAPVLVLVFAVYLDWLPASWAGGSGLSQLALPVIALALPQVAYIARLVRGNMITVLNSDFVRTARAQGLSTASIIRYHAFKPALLPLLSYMGPALAGIVTGSVIVEEVFGVPGVGRFFVQGALNRDYTLVLGITIFYATLIIALNLVVDILYGYVDPRIRAPMNPFRRQVRESRVVIFCGALLLLFAAIAIFGPLLSPHEYARTDFSNALLKPTVTGFHVFGTDEFGRDVFVRTLMGARVTLFVAVVASIVSLGIGVIYGAVAGFVGGKLDAFMMRAVDALYALPFIFFVILLMVVFERNFLLIFVAIGAINWLDMARIVRGQTMSIKQRQFVDAARIIGVSSTGIIFRHIMPNLFGIVVVYLTLTIPQAILIESFVSFLGLGVQEPQTSLGALVNDGVSQMEQAPWLLIIPATVLAGLLLSFNFLGDGLRDLTDPRSKT